MLKSLEEDLEHFLNGAKNFDDKFDLCFNHVKHKDAWPFKMVSL